MGPFRKTILASTILSLLTATAVANPPNRPQSQARQSPHASAPAQQHNSTKSQRAPPPSQHVAPSSPRTQSTPQRAPPPPAQQYKSAPREYRQEYQPRERLRVDDPRDLVKPQTREPVVPRLDVERYRDDKGVGRDARHDDGRRPIGARPDNPPRDGKDHRGTPRHHFTPGERPHIPPHYMPHHPQWWRHWHGGNDWSLFWWFGPWCWDAPWAYNHFYTTQSAVETFDVIPPPGYDNATVTYFKLGPDRTIRVELERYWPSGLELTVLRDDHAGCEETPSLMRCSPMEPRLDQVVSISAPDRETAIDEYWVREGNNFRRENGRLEIIYDQILYPEIRDQLLARGLWR